MVYDATIPMGAVKSTPFALEGNGVKGPGSKILAIHNLFLINLNIGHQ